MERRKVRLQYCRTGATEITKYRLYLPISIADKSVAFLKIYFKDFAVDTLISQLFFSE